jgi:hypothetical protein
MPNRSSPATNLGPPVPEYLTGEQRIALWLSFLNLGTGLVLEGIRRDVGPDGDWQQAYRKWQTEQQEEHDRMICNLLGELGRREQRHGV